MFRSGMNIGVVVPPRAPGTWCRVRRAPRRGRREDSPYRHGRGERPYWQTYKRAAAGEGIRVEIVGFTDYTQSNPALAEGRT
ncbi:hypothetical protein JCM33774_30980 [Actinophytocola sp. KF-1]